MRRPVAVAAALVLLAGCAAPARPAEAPPARTAPAPPAGGAEAGGAEAGGAEAGGAEAAKGFRSDRRYRATPVPTRVEIPRIGVVSTLDRLGRAPDGTVEEPTRWGVAGWYAPGPRPGDPGSAVILGHVDSKRGPAVFYRLRELRRGDEIRVTRADGSTVRFTVERTARHDKRRFPTEDVWFPSLTPALRLVTCGGEFDATAGHYRSNIIVFATPAVSRGR
jgi:sortase (surface protein transpeptidase)